MRHRKNKPRGHLRSRGRPRIRPNNANSNTSKPYYRPASTACDTPPADTPGYRRLPNNPLSSFSLPLQKQNEKPEDDQTEFSDLPPLTDGRMMYSTNEIEDTNGQSSQSRMSDQSEPSTVDHTSSATFSSSNNNFTLPIAGQPLKETDPLKNKLLQFLDKSNMSPLNKIMEQIKSYKKNEFNRALYSLKLDGLVTRSEGNPPVWSLLSRGKEVLQSRDDVSLSKSDTGDFRGKRQISSECIQQLEAVTISSGHAPSDDSMQMYAPSPKMARLNDDIAHKAILDSNDKNPISQLMEYAQASGLRPDFRVSQQGPDHQKRFQVVISLDGKAFPVVEGSSKKDAKTRACQSAIAILRQSAEASSSHRPETTSPQVGTSLDLICPSSLLYSNSLKVLPVPPTAPLPITINFGNSSKNAISFVNEYAQAKGLSIEFQADSYGPDHKKNFRTVLKLGGRFFAPVSAFSKKESKLKAAESALMVLQQSGDFHIPSSANAEDGSKPEMSTYHDRVAHLVNAKFHSLLAELPDTVMGRKIVAGFVMSRTFATELGEETQWSIISIGSGNRCVAGDKLSMQGDTVNDSHAEVIARRGLVRFLYRQIELHSSGDDNTDEDDCILVESEANPSKLELKPGVRFHLYISTAPCGDSALFAKSDLADDVTEAVATEAHGHCPLFDSKKQGILRTKVENGEGCIPIEDDANVPTWDGLLRGERLRTMSCSDKLAKWNFLGLQGALLSQFLQPVYMSSLTLGMLYHHGHLTRAICCRVDKYINMLQPTDIPAQFKVNHPEVAKVSGADRNRETGKIKTREFSLNWCCGDERTEVLDGTVGRCERRYGCAIPVSQVSKSALYALYKRISKTSFESYAKAKEAMTDYKTASALMKKAFAEADCGRWMYKPPEVDDF